jgi:hypothetical protein
MGVRVQAGTLRIPDGTPPANYWYDCIIDTASPGEALTVTNANPSNPRKDYVVAYIDKTVTPTTSVTNNSNNMLKLAVVAGTPASSPSFPNSSQINTAIGGSTNPYVILASIDVAAGATQVTNANIHDTRLIVSLTNDINFADLLSTIFSGQVTTYANPGSAGGTFYYVNLGGIKIFWGSTGSVAVSGSGFLASSTVNVTLPVGFFNTIQHVLPKIGVPSNTNFLDGQYVSANTTTIGVKLIQNSGTNGASPVSLLVIGT